MSERLRIIAAMAKSIGSDRVSFGPSNEVAALIDEQPGRLERTHRYQPGSCGRVRPYSIRHVEVDIDGVTLEAAYHAVEDEVAA